MQVDVAMEVLGLSGEPTAAEVRRAYLRQVKAHPPERDAEGFRRVREAYERLQAGYVAPFAVVAVEEPAPVAGEPVSVADEPRLPVSGQPVQDQLERLKGALAGDQPAAAAESMIWLYTRPLLESVPVPAPALALDTVLALMERGRSKRAGELLKALEDYASLNPLPGGFGNEVAARWKLATELLATSELDARLARALATGLRSGKLFMAGGAAEAAFDEYGPELERHMRERAPTLWAQVAPMLRAQAEQRREVPLSRPGGFRLGIWPAGVVAMIVFNILRLCGAPEHPSRASVDYSAPAPRREAPARPPDLRPDVPVTLSDSQPDPPLPPLRPLPAEAPKTLSESAGRELVLWSLIQEALRLGDCQTVRERWQSYRALASSANAHEDVGVARKRQILEMCPELQELLEEPP